MSGKIELTEEEIKKEKSKYTRKIYTPIYEPKGEKPLIKELYDTRKRDELIAEIEKDEELSDELKEFLKSAAERHTVFYFDKIAEFYSHLPYKFKRHFESSALVIIDYDAAIRNGFFAYEQEVNKDRIQYLEEQLSLEELANRKSEMDKKRIKKFKEELEYLKSKKDKNFIDEEEW